MSTMDKELIEVFKEFDPDSKGYLNPRVMQKVLKHLGFNPSNKEIEQLIVEVDSSENGKIELDEFIEATRRLTSKTKKVQEARESFNTFDFMGKGYIKAADLKDSLMYIMSSATKAEKENLVHHFNLGTNRNIYFEEFSQILSVASHTGDGEGAFGMDDAE